MLRFFIFHSSYHYVHVFLYIIEHMECISNRYFSLFLLIPPSMSFLDLFVLIYCYLDHELYFSAFFGPGNFLLDHKHFELFCLSARFCCVLLNNCGLCSDMYLSYLEAV